MSSLYKRLDSKYYWWTGTYKGRRLRKSTAMTRKHLARKVQDHWDLNLVLGNLGFLGLSTHSPMNISDYCHEYLNFIESRKSERRVSVIRGILKRFLKYIESYGITRLDEITVKVLNGYIDWLQCASGTKKRHIEGISLMLEQAIIEEVISANPAKKVTLPKIVNKVKHRPLEPIDLEIIFKCAGGWSLYYSFLFYTGLRAGDVSMLTYGNINRKKKAIVSFVRKSRRIHELPLVQILMDQLLEGKNDDEPLFPELYTESEIKLNNNLKEPREYLQTLLGAEGRPKATLHSFRVTFNNTLRDFGLPIEDRQILLAHTTSETTKIYTLPNFELASQYVNRIPDYTQLQKT